MSASIRDFIQAMPKVELHLHLEGSLEPELMFALAKRNQIEIPFKTIEEVKEAYNFTDLQSFLDIYYQGMNVLQTEQDFYDLTMAYMEKIASENVRHVEVFFDPQGHTGRGVDFDTVLSGITKALDDAKDKFGTSSEIIMCFLRHLPEKHTDETRATFPGELDAEETLDQLLASPFRDRIIGVGLDSSEVGHPPSKFENVFKRARQEGLLLLAHAGEEGPSDYVYEALDVLKVDRIDHGNRSMENPDLVKRLAQMEVGLTVCPLSNLELRNVRDDDMTQHPLKTMLDAGLKATVNSDDPSYFGGYMNDNFIAVAEALNLNKRDLVTLAQNAIDVSFLSDERKAELTKELSNFFSGWAQATKPVPGLAP